MFTHAAVIRKAILWLRRRTCVTNYWVRAAFVVVVLAEHVLVTDLGDCFAVVVSTLITSLEDRSAALDSGAK